MKCAVTIGALVLAACGGSQKQTGETLDQFDCRDRIASYIATNHIGGDEIGVQIDCKDQGPRLKRWRTTRAGKHLEDSFVLTPGQFDTAWREIDGTGWPNLQDCSNGSLAKDDPVYQFDVKDDTNQASFSCQTREVPYPYNDITDTLDLLANQGHKQLGDYDPADTKALDAKDKQR